MRGSDKKGGGGGNAQRGCCGRGNGISQGVAAFELNEKRNVGNSIGKRNHRDPLGLEHWMDKDGHEVYNSVSGREIKLEIVEFAAFAA